MTTLRRDEYRMLAVWVKATNRSYLEKKRLEEEEETKIREQKTTCGEKENDA